MQQSIISPALRMKLLTFVLSSGWTLNKATIRTHTWWFKNSYDNTVYRSSTRCHRITANESIHVQQHIDSQFCYFQGIKFLVLFVLFILLLTDDCHPVFRCEPHRCITIYTLVHRLYLLRKWDRPWYTSASARCFLPKSFWKVLW